MDVLIKDLRSLWGVLGWSALFILAIRSMSSWYSRRKSSEVTWWSPLLDFLLVGNKPTESEKQDIILQRKAKTESRTPSHKFDSLKSILFSFVGLQASFLTWGWIQERLMTTSYGGSERFPSSNMLVLSNRIFAIVFSYIVIQYRADPTQGKARAPFFAFSFPAIANTVSSFAAYESLKFMSFPMSTVCKTLKIVPTMLMGTVIHRKIYSAQEYASAMLITAGAALFAVEFSAGGLEALLEQSSNVSWRLALPGMVLMTVYLAVDAFTSNLQTLLFKEYLLTPYECMLGINIFSIFLSLFNLAQANELANSISFLSRYPAALVDLVLLALSSASGQLFIYYTIERHGPVTFTIIQLSRQLLAILLSSWSFGHQVNVRAWLGIIMTFSGMLAMNMHKKPPARTDGQSKKNE